MTPGPTPPAGMPRLCRGSHDRPEEGSCLMEFVSVLAGTFFSDHPDCTHPALARLARFVNDGVRDEARARLAVLAPELVDLRGPSRLVRRAVLEHTLAAGLAIAPDDRRLRRWVRPTSTHRAVPRARRRPTLAMTTRAALTRVAALVASLDDPAARDAHLTRLLEETVRDVRVRTGRSVGARHASTGAATSRPVATVRGA